MASYTIIKNNSINIDLPSDIADQGWTISGGIAYHSGCNSGYIERLFDFTGAEEWTFRYTIPSLTSGSINIVVDGETGISRTVAGTYEETFEVTGSNKLVRFFSTGINELQVVKVFKEEQLSNAITMAFSEDANKWVGNRSYTPEFMVKFINDFFIFKDGELWEQNVNPIRNNFFGVQYPSVITFYCNLNPTTVKNFYSMRQKSNKVWSVPEIEIPARYGKPNGQRSRLKKGRFKSYQGDFFADFLRDMEDPRFDNELDALMNGATLQGNYAKITIENNDTTEVRLVSIDLTLSLSQFTY